MMKKDEDKLEIINAQVDPNFATQVERLLKITVYGRWLFLGFLWLTIGSLSLWALRYEIALLQQHFTWVAVSYGLAYNPIPAMGLGLCLGMTVAVMLWQSRNFLVGMPPAERRRLEQQVFHIRQQGKSHPLWNLVCQSKKKGG
ncbi:hypothetical protein [Floridanema evergladense]|uniref:Photosystem I assembly protein Ycf4 n=1 Tax=Floridaenema evergladense BLCC-F167 TaxID=3153639 RepID=A0ABV4WQM7_9CYAN